MTVTAEILVASQGDYLVPGGDGDCKNYVAVIKIL